MEKIDLSSILSASTEIGLNNILGQKKEAEHLQAILSLRVNKDNIRKFAQKVRKLEIARLLQQNLEEAQDKLSTIKGDETITHILGIAEDSILDLSGLLQDSDDAPETIGKGLEDYLKYLGENPVQQIGISTGFPAYDQSIGGGLRPGTINIIAARSKVGKSICGGNMGYHVATKGIPILNLDTEMTKEDHTTRTVAMVSEVGITDIETGKFAQKPDILEKVNRASQKIKNVPYYHKSIAGRPLEDQLAIMRRWMIKEVGLNDDGTAKPCVIIYDYLKLMNSQEIGKDMAEYQVLGFMMTTLHNFAVRYRVPILAFMQLNRDGITKEDTATASGSDRIIWLCSNFTILKYKSDEEVSDDGEKNGNRKLVPVIARHGEGLNDGDYINCHFKGWCAKITEGQTKLELGQSKKNQGFVDDNSDGKINFQ